MPPTPTAGEAQIAAGESAHTPGPWYVRLYPGTDAYEVRASGGALIAQVGNLGSTSDHRPTAKHWKAATPANARLIAAAPDLLEAVQRARRHAMNIGIDSGSYFEILEAAIRKAEGRS